MTGGSLRRASLVAVPDASSETMKQFTPVRPIRRAQSTYVAPQPTRQLNVLTSETPHPWPRHREGLPGPVQALIEARGFSAMRAWRTHRGLSMASTQARTNLCLPTLLALDSGDVALCEWTVDLLAKALRVDPDLLLKAEMLAAAYRCKGE